MVDTLILDLLDPEEVVTPPMAMKDYSDEFKADAMALYESTPGETYNSIAADLGMNRATLREWVLREFGRVFRRTHDDVRPVPDEGDRYVARGFRPWRRRPGGSRHGSVHLAAPG